MMRFIRTMEEFRDDAITTAPPGKKHRTMAISEIIHVEPLHEQVEESNHFSSITDDEEEIETIECTRSAVVDAPVKKTPPPMPLQTYIHLNADPAKRRKTLESLRPMQLAMARRFIRDRSRFLDLAERHNSIEIVQTAVGGDQTAIQFINEPFTQANRTVREVFDAVLHSSLNIEKALAEANYAHDTVREGGIWNDEEIAHHRLVCSTDEVREDGEPLSIDSNSVSLTEYDPVEDVGVMVVRYVDHDELFPYKPRERLRRDVVVMLLVSQEDFGVVLRAWVSTRQRRSSYFKVADDAMERLRGELGQWGSYQLHSVRERLGVKP
ncbi:hypothetical protein Poli38472_004442 [Pythium oligandrum]|uniref:Uncharacterized protein n=1 Tax=Pythium oligandrum TaxID=41045 RepID=A0A8K1CAE6_PYTOL|nr:hypothetical protein Poli38472_004442 [Pythium oligandrum]|eukprot:TMW59373.1 hypothetical protein Poli38472_004442 [Pythium oligandrum]